MFGSDGQFTIIQMKDCIGRIVIDVVNPLICSLCRCMKECCWRWAEVRDRNLTMLHGSGIDHVATIGHKGRVDKGPCDTLLTVSKVVVLNVPLAEKCSNAFRRTKLQIVAVVITIVDTLVCITFSFNKCNSLIESHNIFGFNEIRTHCCDSFV